MERRSLHNGLCVPFRFSSQALEAARSPAGLSCRTEKIGCVDWGLLFPLPEGFDCFKIIDWFCGFHEAPPSIIVILGAEGIL